MAASPARIAASGCFLAARTQALAKRNTRNRAAWTKLDRPVSPPGRGTRHCQLVPKDDQEKVWKQLVDGELAPPDTWEVALSGGGGKCETFERLIAEKKLGGLALLRNLRAGAGGGDAEVGQGPCTA